MADRVKEQLGNYRLTRLLGEGGFAKVYLGEHVHLGTTAAIKVLHTRVAEEEVAAFLREARLLASLKHPHIVRVFDFGVDKQTPYLVMDYAPKGNLRTRHSNGTQLPLPTVVDYVKQVAQALQYAHDRRVVHRDIKPENMLIGERDEILLSDFGIALISHSTHDQSTKDIVGTLAYMSPEQLSGHPCLASDQYSLGIVVYKWLSGTLPFDGSPNEVAIKHAASPPPSLRNHLPELSSSVEKVIFRALEKEPEKRFASVQDFATALEQAYLETLPTKEQQLRSLSPLAMLPTLQLPIPKLPQRANPVLISVLLVMLILGGIFGVLYLLLPKTPTGLCNSNSPSTSANTSVDNMPATSTSPDGEPIGLSIGAAIFDCNRLNQQEVQYKRQAATTNDPQRVIPALKKAIDSDPTDAETQIYLENWKVLQTNHPYSTLVVGVSFARISEWASRSALQGSFTAQKEYNEKNWHDVNKTLIVLMIANVGGDTNGHIINESSKFVADQVVDQAARDKTIVGIMGWPISPATINVQHELHTRGSNLPILAACSSSDILTGTAHFFRICPKDVDHTQMIVNFVLKTMQKKRIGILYQDASAYTDSMRRDLANDLPKANMVGEESYTTNSQGDIRVALNKLLDRKPDAIVFIGYGSDLVTILNDIPHNLLILGGNSLATTGIYPQPLPYLHNLYFTAFASPNEWDGINPKPLFFQEYKYNFGKLTDHNGLPGINTAVMLGYDALSTLLYSSQQVLSTKNTLTPSDLEAALKQITGTNAIQGVTGRIAFDSYGDQDQHKMFFVEHIEGTSLVIDERYGCLLKDNCNL